MIPVTIDVETHPIQPGRQAPPVVCLQVRDASGARIEAGDRAIETLRGLLSDPKILIVAHNAAFEATSTIATWPELLPLWLAAYDADRVTCTMLREKLARIAQGTLKYRYPKSDLLSVAERYKIPHGFLATDKTSPESPRVRFREVAGLDPSEYPADFRRYALADLVAGDVYDAQARTFPPAFFVDQFRQARGAFFLAYTSAWGMRVDARAVEALGRRTEIEHAEARAILTGVPGALKRAADAWDEQHPNAPARRSSLEQVLVRPIGSKDTKAAARRMIAACADAGLPIPRTKTGKDKIAEGADVGDEYVALDADACAVSLDPALIAYARYTSIGTVRGRVERLRLAADLALPVQPFFDPLKETGRTSASSGDRDPGVALTSIGDQVQNLPREPGLRECYVARPGYWIASVDWRAAELHGLAQSCLDLGFDSQLGRVLNSGQDVHLWFASQVKGWSYEWAHAALKGKHGPDAQKTVKAARQGAKACMFGFPGGLGIEKFRGYARNQYQVILSDEQAREQKNLWLAAFPEMSLYLEHASETIRRGAHVIHTGSWRYRMCDRYTSAANSPFQGKIGDMLKDAGWRLTKRFLPGGDLHGRGRPWNQAHDEILCEVRTETAHETALEIVRTMEDVGRDWCPGCPVGAEPALQIHWRKGAEPAYDASTGRLIPHEHRELGEKTIEAIRKDLARGVEPVYVSWTYGIEEDRAREIGR